MPPFIIAAIGVPPLRFETKMFYMTNPRLERALDTKSLVSQAIETLLYDKAFIKLQQIDPFRSDWWLDATLTMTFPDLVLTDITRVGKRYRDEVIRRLQQRVLNAWHSVATHMITEFDVVSINEEKEHELRFSQTSQTPRDGGRVLVETMTFSITYIDARSVHLLEIALAKMLSPPQFQLAKEISLKLILTGTIGTADISKELFSGTAAIQPIPHWLTLDKKPQVSRFFHVPGLAGIIADACRGFLVTVDAAGPGIEPAKRRNIDGVPITIETPEDVVSLVDDYNFFAFYPAISMQDGSVGRLVGDLDIPPSVVSLLSADGAWKLACAASDGIVDCGMGLGFPMPGRHFSGSRGLHVFWNVEPSAFQLDEGTGRVDIPAYLRAVRAVDRTAGFTKTSRRYVADPDYASRLVLEALILRAKFTTMAGKLLDKRAMARLGVEADHHAITVSRFDPLGALKIIIDCQPTVHRWFSPHAKSGRVGIPLTDADGAIKKSMREYDQVQIDAEISAVTAAMMVNPLVYRESPGLVTRDMVAAACEPDALGGDICVLLDEGQANACVMDAGAYASRRQYFIDELKKEKDARD